MTSASLSPAAPPTPAQRTGPRSGTTATERIRLFVGGLPADVTAEELQMRFQPFGKVIGSEIVPQKEDGANCRGFGYVDLEPVSEASLSKCFAVYNGTKWRGGRLRVEKARASFLDRLKAEWAAPIGAQSEADNLGPESDKRGEEIYKPGAEPTKAELLDTKGPNGKPIFEPLRLKWGSWEYEKRTKVMPAAGGVKIKKSFRNVPEKSIWELEGMGGTEALSTSNPPPARGVVATRAIETRPFGVNGVSLTRERLEEGSAEEKAPETEEGDEDSEGRSEDEGTEGSGREVEERAGDGVKGGVKELTAWEKLMQKAAAGQEDDNFIDEEVGGLAGFGAVGKLPGNPGTAKRTEDVGGLEGSGAVGKSPVDPGTARLTDASEERPPVGGGLERGEVRGKKEGAKQRANDSVPAAGEGVTKAEPVGLSDWERLMQKAAGAWDDEESLDGLETGEFEQASGDGESDAGEGDDLNGDELEGGPDDSKEERPGMGIEGLDGDQELGAKEESTRVEELDLEASDGVPDNVAAAGEGASEDGALAERSGGAEFGEEVLSEDDVMEDADVMDGGGTEGEADDDLEGDEVGDGEEGTTDSGGSVDEEGSEEADDSGEESFESEEERSGSVSEEEEEVSEAEGQEWQGGVSEDEERSSGEGAGVSDGKERDSVGPEAESGGAKTESGEAAAESGDDGGASDGEAEADTDGGISEEVPDDDENLDEGGGNVKDDMDSGREQPLWESASELQQPVKALDDAEAEFETAPVEEVDAEVPAAGVSPEPAGADGTDSAAADGTAAGRTAEEEEIARQLAEERRKQLGILGAMFPDDARFFSEEAVQKAKPLSGFVPVARFDPSAAAKESLGDDEIGSGAGERLTEAARMETETSVGSGLTKSGRKTVTRTATAERDPETSGKEASTAGVKPKSKTAGVTGSKTPRRAASDSKIPVTEWKRGVTRKVGDLKNELVKEKGKGGGTGSARGSGNGSRSGLEMVGDVVSGLSPQVLKYLDADLLQRLTSASKGTRTEGKRRGGDGEKEGKRKRGQLEGVEKGKKRQRVKSEEPERGGEKETGDSGGGARGARSEGAEAKREERGGGRTAEAKKERQEASRKKEKRGQRPETREEILGVGAREKTTGKGVPGEELTQGLRKRKHRDSGQEDGSGGTEHKPRQETADAVNVTGQNVQGRSNEAAVGGPPEDTTGGLSVEERKRLKREKRAQRRGSEAAGIADAGMDRLDAGTDRLVSPTAAPVKQEVFVNPNWRALVGYVGGGKPTFSLASVLGGVADAGPSGPSDGTKASVNGQNAVANTVSGIDTHAADENSGAKTEFGVDLAPVRRNASEGPTGGRIPLPDAAKSSSAVIAADPPAGAPRHDDVSTGGSLAAGGPGDEDLGLSFVRSATAEQEWMASKSALAIDYKRKKRIAARVAPGGGKKRG